MESHDKQSVPKQFASNNSGRFPIWVWRKHVILMGVLFGHFSLWLPLVLCIVPETNVFTWYQIPEKFHRGAGEVGGKKEKSIPETIKMKKEDATNRQKKFFGESWKWDGSLNINRIFQPTHTSAIIPKGNIDPREGVSVTFVSKCLILHQHGVVSMERDREK